MNKVELLALADRIETVTVVEPKFVGALLDDLAKAFKYRPGSAELDANLSLSTDAAIALVRQKLPGWFIVIHGAAMGRDTIWKCTLRKSEVSDDDELVGVGSGHSIPMAILAALIRIAAHHNLFG